MAESLEGTGVWQRIVTDRAELERIHSEREDPQWRPGAMKPEERERLVRIGLEVVLGDQAPQLTVCRSPNDSIFVTDPHGHGFGFPPDQVLGDDPQIVLEHDMEWLVDELCETSVAWGERLPMCPIHPGAHPLTVSVTHELVIATCPIDGVDIRTNSY